MLADGGTACAAMAAAAASHGYAPVVLSTALEGEARELGRTLGTLAAESARHGRPFAGPAMLLGCGGETTVTLHEGAFGDGGPNQEVALAFALALDGAPYTAGIFLDTDGSDGGTAIAGALVDGGTAGRARGARPRPRRRPAGAPGQRAAGGPRRHRPDRPDRHQRQRPVRDRDRRPTGDGMSDTGSIVLDGVGKTFGDTTAVHEISLAIAGGRVLLAARAERVRQDDDAADDRRVRDADERAGRCSRATT